MRTPFLPASRVTLALGVLSSILVVVAFATVPTPVNAHGDRRGDDKAVAPAGTSAPRQTGPIRHLGNNPSQAGISGCLMPTAPLFVTSGLDSVRVWNVKDPAHPRQVGVLANALFENEAMNCGERRTKQGIRRFALIGVDAVQASPDDPHHVNSGGNELVVVDVTRPARPRIISRAPSNTSTHTVACVRGRNCRYAYTAGDATGPGDRGVFTIFDLRRIGRPQEVDSNKRRAGVQPFRSPTPAHKWNFDSAGIGTHTGWGGASMWDTSRPRHPRLLTTTGKIGAGDDPRYPGWNNFILHNSFRPHARAFKPDSKPSFENGNVLLVTEEDYEKPNCQRAGSFQTWWIKRLDGTPSAIRPLDKVELLDLGEFPTNYPSPLGAFCSAHWFDFRPGGRLVAAGFYGGGTQIIDVSDPRNLKTYASAIWPSSQVWDAMWVPRYRNGRQIGGRTNVVYAIDLQRGFDVYAVDVPGDNRGAVPPR